MKKVLRFHPDDDVAVALENLSVGDTLCINGQETDICMVDSLPQGHKAALRNIGQGEQIRKYGHVVGTASCNIPQGGYVHVHNIEDTITDWRGNIRYSYDPAGVRELSEEFCLPEQPALTGYRRKDGSVGFRNYLLVVSTCVCGNQPVEELKHRLWGRKDIVCITNPSGCVILPNDREMQCNMLLGLARNPNVGAVIFVGLGCEAVLADELYEAMKDEKPGAYFVSHHFNSCDEATDELEKKALELRAEIDTLTREPASVADIRVGVQCGASDWTTAAAANPAIGYCSDIIVKNGGISVLGETCGWFGGEESLVLQARSREVAERIMSLMGRIYDQCLFHGRRIEEANPAPGNIAGGISTLCEKALGNTLKGGTAPIEGVLEVGGQPEGKGLYVADNPGLDATSVFAQTMSSCNVILYSTGRGSPVGTPIAPVVKLTASPTAASVFGSHMDVVLTDLVLDGVSISEGGHRLFKKVIEVCNGVPSVAEAHGHREYSFPLMMGPM